jgi:hypothetical protein
MKFLDKYLSLKCFFISFCIGMFMVYILTPLPEIIIRYPTPHNAGKIVYKDSADMCYVYDAREVSCPNKGVVNIPLQITNNTLKNNKGAFTKIFDRIQNGNKNRVAPPKGVTEAVFEKYKSF